MITQQDANDVLKLTDDIIVECGPRLAGSKASKKAGEIIYNHLKKHCHNTAIEEFDFHRNAFLSFLKIIAIIYLPAILLLTAGGNWIFLSSLIFLAGAFVTVTEFVFYKETLDIFFKKYKGYNIIGIINPKREIKQNIIISSHHDSAYVFNFLSRWQKAYAPRIGIGILTYFLATAFSNICALYKVFTNDSPQFIFPAIYVFLGGYIFVFQLYFFIGRKVNPGAGDNLVASSMGIKLAEVFGKVRNTENLLFEHTKLTILSLDAEESGLRGARAFATRHKEELLAVPTFIFNIDNIYNVNELSFLTADINGTVKLSEKMANQCISIANRLGYKVTSAPITFGGGGTDAGEFGKIGVEATTLIGMENKFIRDGLVYHTMQDTVDKIQPEAVMACLKIASEYILLKDKESSKNHSEA